MYYISKTPLVIFRALSVLSLFTDQCLLDNTTGIQYLNPIISYRNMISVWYRFQLHILLHPVTARNFAERLRLRCYASRQKRGLKCGCKGNGVDNIPHYMNHSVSDYIGRWLTSVNGGLNGIAVNIHLESSAVFTWPFERSSCEIHTTEGTPAHHCTRNAMRQRQLGYNRPFHLWQWGGRRLFHMRARRSCRRHLRPRWRCDRHMLPRAPARVKPAHQAAALKARWRGKYIR